MFTQSMTFWFPFRFHSAPRILACDLEASFPVKRRHLPGWLDTGTFFSFERPAEKLRAPGHSWALPKGAAFGSCNSSSMPPHSIVTRPSFEMKWVQLPTFQLLMAYPLRRQPGRQAASKAVGLLLGNVPGAVACLASTSVLPCQRRSACKLRLFFSQARKLPECLDSCHRRVPCCTHAAVASRPASASRVRR